MNARTAAQEVIATTGKFPITLLSVGLPRGTVLHLFDEAGDRAVTLCGRRITTNSRYLGLGSKYVLPSEAATCKRCVRVASGMATTS